MVPSTSAVTQLADQLGRLLVRANREALYNRLTDGVDGVTPTTYPVLSGIARGGPTTVTHLATLIGLDRTVVTRYVTTLADAGLVSRTTDPGDKRATTVALTDVGRAAVQKMRQRLHRTLAEATDDWAAGDVDALGELLGRLVDGFNAPR